MDNLLKKIEEGAVNIWDENKTAWTQKELSEYVVHKSSEYKEDLEDGLIPWVEDTMVPLVGEYTRGKYLLVKESCLLMFQS